MRYFILFILMLVPSVVTASAPIDIFINGVHYPSIEAYKRSKDKPPAQDKAMDNDQSLVDPSISAQTVKQLKAVGVEQGIGKQIVDFTQNWQNPTPKFVIVPDELEHRMEALIDGRKEPVLVVTGDNKLRVMQLKSAQ